MPAGTSGVKWGEDYRLENLRCAECRTCRFDNVCLNHTSGSIVFFKGSQDILYYHEQTGEAQYNFPDDFVMLGMICHSFCREFLTSLQSFSVLVTLPAYCCLLQFMSFTRSQSVHIRLGTTFRQLDIY